MFMTVSVCVCVCVHVCVCVCVCVCVYRGCWRRLSLLHSRCGRSSRIPNLEDPPAPVYCPAARRSQLTNTETSVPIAGVCVCVCVCVCV